MGQSLILLTSLLLSVIGCNQHILHIELIKGFTGQVRLVCSQEGKSPSKVLVDQNGYGQITCSRQEPILDVTRSGQHVPISGLVLITTGDGILQAIDFYAQ
jgi:hypothetical protein